MDGIPNEKLAETKPPTESVPLRGYLTQEEDGQLWIQDRTGTWIVNEEDIVTREDWKGDELDPRFSGEPISVFVREGAEIHELRPYTIETDDRPITLVDPSDPCDLRGLPDIPGIDEVIDLERNFGRHLGIDTTDAQGTGCTNGTSLSCHYTGGYPGQVCTTDDSSCD